MDCSARSASSVDLSGTRPTVRLPQTTRRSGFSAWTGDERMSTFVLSAPGQPPRQGELQRLKLLDAREPRPAEGPVDVPKVHSDATAKSIMPFMFPSKFMLEMCFTAPDWVVMQTCVAWPNKSAS